jgi:hypothetical protein
VVQDEQRCVDAARLVVMRLCSQAVAILRADDEAQSAQDEQRCAWKPQSENAQIADPPSQVAPMDSAIPVPQCVASSHAVIELDESTNKAGDRRWIGCCFVGPERASLCQPFLGYKYRY